MDFFKTLKPNLYGRDFVVGDIHGCFTMLEQAMQRVEFDKETDRILSVGDLVDRGPESVRCLDFLSQPWFHAIRGNHDQSLLDYAQARGEGICSSLDQFYKNMPYAGYDNLDNVYIRWGSEWQKELPLETLFKIADAMRQLPFAMEVETTAGLIGFVHADIPHNADWKKFKEDVEKGLPNITEYALWARNRLQKNHTAGVAGLYRLYVGHSVVESVKFLGNVCFIDTGASIVDEGGDKNFGCITLAEITAPQNKFVQKPDGKFNIVVSVDAPVLLSRRDVAGHCLG